MAAGAGVSYAVYEERNNRVRLLKEMEQSLGKLAYYMCEWRMPLEEAFIDILKEPYPMLIPFYKSVLEDVLKRNVENMGELWKRKSEVFLENTSLEKAIKELWAGCLCNIPIEPEALKMGFQYKREQLQAYLTDLQDKYKVEQKMVWTLGLCTSAFLCLIIW